MSVLKLRSKLSFDMGILSLGAFLGMLDTRVNRFLEMSAFLGVSMLQISDLGRVGGSALVEFSSVVLEAGLKLLFKTVDGAGVLSGLRLVHVNIGGMFTSQSALELLKLMSVRSIETLKLMSDSFLEFLRVLGGK